MAIRSLFDSSDWKRSIPFVFGAAALFITGFGVVFLTSSTIFQARLAWALFMVLPLWLAAFVPVLCLQFIALGLLRWWRKATPQQEFLTLNTPLVMVCLIVLFGAWFASKPHRKFEICFGQKLPTTLAIRQHGGTTAMDGSFWAFELDGSFDEFVALSLRMNMSPAEKQDEAVDWQNTIRARTGLSVQLEPPLDVCRVRREGRKIYLLLSRNGAAAFLIYSTHWADR